MLGRRNEIARMTRLDGRITTLCPYPIAPYDDMALLRG